MAQVIPAILAKSEEEFRHKLAQLDGVAPVIHLDIMDGVFVPNQTWFDPMVLHDLPLLPRFELHLMTSDPKQILHDCEDIDCIERMLWHIEAAQDSLDLIKLTRHSSWEAGIAINPDTKLTELDPYFDLVDEILIMGAAPGFSGKPLETRAVDRVTEIQMHHPELTLGFDIGVSPTTIPMLKAAGVQRFCAASAIFQSVDPKATFLAMQKMVE